MRILKGSAKLLAILVAIIVLAGIFFLVYGRENTWALLTGPNDLGRYDFASGARRPTRNDALACSPGACDRPDWTLPTYRLAPAALIDDLARHLQAIFPTAKRVDDGGVSGYARFVVFTPVMRFPDTLDMQATREANGRTALRIYSRSKLGSGDFGANRARIMKLMKGFRPGRGSSS